MKIYKKTALAILGLSAALSGTTAAAATWTDTLAGTYVTYHFNSADLGLFGTASLSGDDLVFTPFVGLDGKSLFTAQSTNGSLGYAVKTLNIEVTANSGYQLSALNLAETGSYALTGSASALVTGNITALDIEGTTDNEEVGAIATSAALDVFGATTGWTANAGVVLPATGWGGNDGVVQSVGLTISNQLFPTTSALGGTAQIWKNAVSLSIVTSPVPEAETYAMMLAGLGLVGFMARRRSISVA